MNRVFALGSQTLRRPFRRVLRFAMRFTPEGIRLLAARVPFSRYHRIASWLLWGREVITWRNVSIAVNPGTVLGYYTYLFGSYAQAEIDRLTHDCSNAAMFADIGANAGLISLALAKACPKLTVFAFEPSREVIPLLYANLQYNPQLSNRVQVIEQAVGDTLGTEFFLPSSANENPEIGHLTADAAAGYPVSITTLDDFFRNRTPPDVIKIDVEGAEIKVLRGMASLWAQGYPKTMLIETHAFYTGEHAADFNTELIGLLYSGGWSLDILRGERWEHLTGGLGTLGRTHILAYRQ